MGDMRTGIYSRRCWVDSALREATIVISHGKIERIVAGRHAAAFPVIDCGDNVVMPGVVDAHVHVNEPGRTEWEGFETATRAAAAGGTTTIVDMPLNSIPVTIDARSFDEKKAATAGKLHVHAGFWAGFTGQETTALRSALDTGCLGVKAFLIHPGIDEFAAVTRTDLERVMPVIGEYGLPLLVHCELVTGEDGDHTLRASPSHYAAFLASRPREWENAAVRMMIELAERFQCRTHIVHLSSADVLPDIAAAKARGVPLTVETCPHYLFFTAESIPDAQPLYKCAPPIRAYTNNQRLKQALRDGLIDFLASDHSPSPPGMKALATGSFLDAWGGIAGLQFLLPVSWTALKDHLSLEAFIPLLTSHPAQFIGADSSKGYLRTGYDADLVIWSPEETLTVESRTIQFRHKISPYIGHTLHGVVHRTIVQGATVIKDGQFNVAGRGELVLSRRVSL